MKADVIKKKYTVEQKIAVFFGMCGEAKIYKKEADENDWRNQSRENWYGKEKVIKK